MSMQRVYALWAYHNLDGLGILFEESRKMVEAVNMSGGNAKLTVCDGVKHDTYLEVFRNRELFNWILSHKLKGILPRKPRFTDLD